MVDIDLSDAELTVYRRKNSPGVESYEVNAVQINWDNWNDICLLLDLENTPGYGVWVNPETGSYAKVQETDKYTELGVVFPSPVLSYLARTGIWILREIEGDQIYFLSPEEFDELYERVDTLGPHDVIAEGALDQNVGREVPLVYYSRPGDYSSRKVIGRVNVEDISGQDMVVNTTIDDPVYRGLLDDPKGSFSIGYDDVVFLSNREEEDDGRQSLKAFDISRVKPRWKRKGSR